MSNPQHEPTMEEILASIRKIISEDSNEEEQPAEAASEPVAEDAAPEPAAEEAAPEPAAVLHAASEPAADDDILELTDALPDEPAPRPEPLAEADEVVFQTLDDEPVAVEPAPEVAPEPMPEPAPVMAAAEESDIFSDKTRQALDDAFASIEAEDEPEPAPARAAPVPGLDGASVEAVFDRAVRESFDPVLREWLSDHTDAVVERMKPVVREWLDQHFPAMLEEAVRNEVARVAKSRRR